MTGSAVSGWMTNGPVPGIANLIVSGSVVLDKSAMIKAWRSEPGPLSLVLVTIWVFALTEIETVAAGDAAVP